MKVNINGSLHELETELPISEFIKSNGFDPRKIVIEHNGRIIGKSNWKTVILRNSDHLVVLSFVGGG